MARRQVGLAVLVALLSFPSGAAGFDSLAIWGSYQGPDFAGPAAVAIDGSGRVIVVDPGHQQLQLRSPAGALLDSWPGEPRGFAYPRDVAAGRDGSIYVPAYVPRPDDDPGYYGVVKLSRTGAVVDKWGGAELDGFGVATDRTGRVYVADRAHDRVVVYDESGRVLAKWTETATGRMSRPRRIAVAPDGAVYVSGDHGLARLTHAGAPVWTLAGRVEGGLAVDPDGRIYFVPFFDPFGGPQVQVRAPDGTLLSEFGPHGRAPGEVERPGGLALDCRFNIYVAETGGNRIQKFGERPETDMPCPAGQPPDPPPPPGAAPPADEERSAPSAQDRSAPKLAVSTRRRPRYVAVTVRCSEDCRVRVTGTARRGRRRAALRSNPRWLPAHVATVRRLALPRRVRGRNLRIALTVTASDRSGNTAHFVSGR